MARYEVSKQEFSTIGMAVFTDALNSIGADGGGYLDILEPGLYELTAPLYAPANTVITVGPGVTLKSVGGTYLIRNVSSGCLNYKAPGNIHVRGEGVLDANGNRFTGTDGCGGVAFVQCENVSVTGVTITGIRNWHAIEYQSVKGGRIENVTALDFSSAGGGWMAAEAFQLDLNQGDWSPCQNILVQGCTTKGYGKLVGSHASRNGKAQSDIRVIGNSAEGCCHYAVGGENWRYVAVTGNTFLSCNGVVQMRIPSVDDGGAAFTSHNKGFVISGNVSIGSGAQNGYQYKMASAVDIVSDSSAIKNYNAGISGNTLQGSNTYGVRTANASQFYHEGNNLNGFATPYYDV